MNRQRRNWLSDEEYNEAYELAKKEGYNLDKRCPTCDNRLASFEDEDPQEPTYRYRGETYPCDCNEQIALFARYILANIGEQYMRLDWADFDGSPEAQEFVPEYIDKWKNYRKHGWGVEFGGTIQGTGKTFAATHIGKELIKRGQKVHFIPFVEMSSSFQVNGQELELRLRTIPWLILDEVIEGSMSAAQQNFFADRFEALIRHRTNHNLPTIITTNLSAEDLNECYPRTYSLLAAKQNRIDMTGNDVRADKIKLENMELIANDEVRPIT